MLRIFVILFFLQLTIGRAEECVPSITLVTFKGIMQLYDFLDDKHRDGWPDQDELKGLLSTGEELYLRLLDPCKGSNPLVNRKNIKSLMWFLYYKQMLECFQQNEKGKGQDCMTKEVNFYLNKQNREITDWIMSFPDQYKTNGSSLKTFAKQRKKKLIGSFRIDFETNELPIGKKSLILGQVAGGSLIKLESIGKKTLKDRFKRFFHKVKKTLTRHPARKNTKTRSKEVLVKKMNHCADKIQQVLQKEQGAKKWSSTANQLNSLQRHVKLITPDKNTSLINKIKRQKWDLVRQMTKGHQQQKKYKEEDYESDKKFLQDLQRQIEAPRKGLIPSELIIKVVQGQKKVRHFASFQEKKPIEKQEINVAQLKLAMNKLLLQEIEEYSRFSNSKSYDVDLPRMIGGEDFIVSSDQVPWDNSKAKHKRPYTIKIPSDNIPDGVEKFNRFINQVTPEHQQNVKDWISQGFEVPYTRHAFEEMTRDGKMMSDDRIGKRFLKIVQRGNQLTVERLVNFKSINTDDPNAHDGGKLFIRRMTIDLTKKRDDPSAYDFESFHSKNLSHSEYEQYIKLSRGPK